MDYTVTIELRAPKRKKFTVDVAEALAELGGAASFSPERVSATFTVDGDDPLSAMTRALERVATAAKGDVVRVDVMTVAEHDRLLDEPAFPRLVGVSEIAEELSVSRQRVAELRRRPDFPAPIAKLKAGPVWRAGDLSRFVDEWTRKPGRPRKETDPDDRLMAALEEREALAGSGHHGAPKMAAKKAPKRRVS